MEHPSLLEASLEQPSIFFWHLYICGHQLGQLTELSKAFKSKFQRCLLENSLRQPGSVYWKRFLFGHELGKLTELSKAFKKTFGKFTRKVAYDYNQPQDPKYRNTLDSWQCLFQLREAERDLPEEFVTSSDEEDRHVASNIQT